MSIQDGGNTPLVVSSQEGPQGPAGPPAGFNNDTFIPILNQTIFVLSAVPANASSIMLFVNGVRYQMPFDFTVAIATITWTNVLFNLTPDDVVQVFYEV